MALYKTTIVIWSEYPGDQVELEDLAREATMGDAYCSKQESVRVENNDPAIGADDGPSRDFFGLDDAPLEETKEN